MKLRVSLLLVVLGCGSAASPGASTYETPATRRARATEEARIERYKEAEAAYQSRQYTAATELFTGLALEEPEQVFPRLRLATMAQRQHLYGDAERWLREVLRLEPYRIETRYALVAVLIREDRTDDAARELQAAMTARGNPVTELKLKAALALRRGRYEQATTMFHELLRRAPDDASGRVGLGVIRAVAGDLAGARRDLEAARDLSPGAAVIRYNLALVLYRSGDLEEAAREGAAAVELDPYYVPARTNLATVLVELGRNEDARRVLQEAVAIRPGYAPARNNLGIVLLRLGELGAAVTEMERAVHHAPRVPAFHFNLGLVYFKSGDVAGARRAFEKVLELEPGNRAARRNLRWIEGLERGTLRGDSLPVMSSRFQVEEYEG